MTEVAIRIGMWKMAAILAFVGASSSAAGAHSGGLNAEGCHTNRKTGDYHCHRGASAPRRAAPAAAIMPLAGSREGGTRPFVNCSEAKAAGVGNIRAGDPRYGLHLDRDEDGIGCEWN